MLLTSLGGLALGTFQRVKPLLLLVYLALEGQTARHDLRELLWPAAKQPDASLRVAIHELRKCGEQVISGEATLVCGVPCDAALLLTARGAAALTAYRGAFLQGVPLNDVSTEFEEWLERQRARLAAHVQGEALALAERSAPERAAGLADRIYRLPGALPPELEMLRRLRNLTLPGSALEAELSAELHELTGISSQAPSAAPLRRVIGRAREVDRLLAWAVRPDTRLAVVSGPGGIGKSTLLREVLRELSLLGRRVMLVDAEGATSPSDLFMRLASTCAPGSALQGSWAELWPLLGEQPVILLDGLDDLADAAGLLDTLRSELPDARWILAGRRKIGRQVREHEQRSAPEQGPTELALLLPITGLAEPPPGAELPEIASSSAVALFVREAARVQRGFQLSETNAELIAGIGRRLAGHPLALSLAASWLRSETLDNVYLRVLQDAGQLSSPGEDEDGRRSLLLVAQRSWDLLSAEEQAAALRLSVCTDFDPLDAPDLGVSTRLLDALLEHSFLESFRPGSERLRFSPALTGLLQVQSLARPVQHEEARRRFARHYLEEFAALAPESPEVDAERDNLRRAISVSLAAGTLDAGTLERLLAHYDRRGLLSGGTDVFAGLVEEVEDHHAPDSVQAAAQIGCMWLAYRSGRLLDAQTLAARFLQGPLAQDPASRMKALNTLASIRATQGQRQVAVEMQTQVVQLARQLGDEGRVLSYRMNLLSILGFLGDAEQARCELAELEAALPHLPPEWALEVRRLMLQVTFRLPGSNLPSLREQAVRLVHDAEQIGNTSVALAGLVTLCGIDLRLGHLSAVRATLGTIRAGSGAPAGSDIGAELLLTELELLYRSGRSVEARTLRRNVIQTFLNRGNPWELVEVFLLVAADISVEETTHVQRFHQLIAGDSNIHVEQRERARTEVRVPVTRDTVLDLAELTAWLRSQLA